MKISSVAWRYRASMGWTNVTYDVAHLVLALEYLTLFVIALYATYRLAVQDGSPAKWKICFFSLLLLGALGIYQSCSRDIYLSLISLSLAIHPQHEHHSLRCRPSCSKEIFSSITRFEATKAPPRPHTPSSP